MKFIQRLLQALRLQPKGYVSMLVRHESYGYVTVRGDRDELIRRCS